MCSFTANPNVSKFTLFLLILFLAVSVLFLIFRGKQVWSLSSTKMRTACVCLQEVDRTMYLRWVDRKMCTCGGWTGLRTVQLRGWTGLRIGYLQRVDRAENCLPTRDGQNLELCTCKGWTQFRSVFKYTHGVDRSENMYL